MALLNTFEDTTNMIEKVSMRTGTYYCPKTNRVNPTNMADAVYVGSRKLAEAITTLSPKDRAKFWAIHTANNPESGHIAVDKMPSRIKVRLNRLGIV